MKVMKKNLFLSLLLLCSMMFFASCTKSDAPGSSDNNSDAIAEMQIAASTNDNDRYTDVYIYRKDDKAYLRTLYSYAYVGKVTGLKDMERFIFDMPALTETYSAISLLISEGDGYIIKNSSYYYECWYIHKINRDASGDVVNVFYYVRGVTPYVGWY